MAKKKITTSAELNLESLHLLSARLRADFKQQLDIAIADCKMRPDIEAKRVVKIELVIVPNQDKRGEVLILPATSSKTPPRKLEPIAGKIGSKAGQLEFEFTE